MSDTVWIVLFRGVGGKTLLPVKPLRDKLAEAGFRHVATYINSGNAVVVSERSRETVRAAISEICAREFGFEKDIHLVSLAEWERLIAQNPFPEATGAGKYLHAAVLGAEPKAADVTALRVHAVDGESIAVVDRVAYLHTPHGFGLSKLAAKFDKGIKVPNTARNWNTVVRLGDLARAAARAA
ncbi:DUF1697 domain-containing protein [Nitratireductor sp. CAU 1489]|uniref:DUF1697 domain-containing protein n=1 Tax=Nitratireductor arenosus TaxID=2682096 RepID=A0A844QC01_9HYPH|nr:DUF1697 domain-containing protein [Nitratireductor arenosus]MVA97546.1 DUF1697 domain-containing protein [Nitratireductor arenosus]